MAGLAHRGQACRRDARRQSDGDARGGTDQRLVPPDKLARPVKDRRRPGQDRLADQEAVQIVRQVAGGGVTAAWGLRQTLQTDRFQIPAPQDIARGGRGSSCKTRTSTSSGVSPV